MSLLLLFQPAPLPVISADETPAIIARANPAQVVPALLQQWSSFQPLGYPPSPGQAPSSKGSVVVFIQTVVAPGTAFVPPPPASAPPINAFAQSPEKFAAAVPATTQLFQSSGFQPVPVRLGWIGQWDSRFAAVPAQSETGLLIVQPPAVTNTTVYGWFGYQLDAQFARSVPSATQQWAAFQPQGFIASTFPDGWRGAQWEIRYAAATAPVLQQYAAQIPQPPYVFPEGWRGLQWECRFVPGYPAAEQTFAPAPAVSPAVSPGLGWWGEQLGYRFSAAVPASVQQWSAFQAQGPIFTRFPDGWRGAQFEFQFAATVSPALAQFLALWTAPFVPGAALSWFPNHENQPTLVSPPSPEFGGQPIVVPAAPVEPVLPPAGGGRRKPVRPIWDRGEQEAQQQQPSPAHQTPVPGPKPASPANLPPLSLLAATLNPANPIVRPTKVREETGLSEEEALLIQLLLDDEL